MIIEKRDYIKILSIAARLPGCAKASRLSCLLLSLGQSSAVG
jgi:hypothetical protein